MEGFLLQAERIQRGELFAQIKNDPEKDLV